jgi:hypothetical protein
MATTTTNNAWPIPQSTDLVKDGATAIASLGSAIDTTLGVYGASSYVLIGTTTFSAVASQNFTTSTTYDNYKVVINNLSCSTNSVELRMQFRNSGGNISATNYRWVLSRAYVTGTSPSTEAATSGTYGYIGAVGTPTISSAEFILNNMSGTSVRPSYSGLSNTNEGTNSYLNIFAGHYNSDITPTGFSLLPSSGTISGTVRLYGLKK